MKDRNLEIKDKNIEGVKQISKDQKNPKQSIIGMRIIKTIVSVYVSVMIVSIRGGNPINAAVAGVLTTQDSHKGSKTYGKNRIIGTFIGAIFALLFVFLVDEFDIPLFTPLYYACMTLLLIPIIKLNLFLKLPGAISSACIAFLIALMSYISQSDLKYIYVFNRIVDTFIGVSITIAVNELLPDNRENRK